MTGHGEAHGLQDGVAVTVEIRTVNNRYLKLTLRMSEGYGSLEPQLEALLRQHLRRGTFTVYAQIAREATPGDYRLNEAVLVSYRQQLEELRRAAGLTEPVRLESLLALPGAVLEGASHHAAAEADWPLLERTALTALENLARMRRAEGEAMLVDLRTNCRTIAASLDQIQLRAPLVVEGYRDRLLERLNRLLKDVEIRLGADDVAREVAVLADRSDISEELTRLRSHLEQFDSLAEGSASNGRKLEFVIQEMFREANTIGSKANDVDISRRVIDIKAGIERMRELIQNVE
jgi:uncharacterized protein (TIGR00255 family)